MRKSKISIKVRKDIWDKFCSELDSSGCIRRDPLLNMWLGQDIDLIKKLPTNQLSNDEYRVLIRPDWVGEKQAVGLFLNSDLINELSKILRDKNVPRNVFFNCYIEHVAMPLLINLNTQIFDASYMHFDDGNKGGSHRPYDYLFPTDKMAQKIKKHYKDLQEAIKESFALKASDI